MDTTDLSQATLLDLDGSVRTLASLWADQPAVLVFLRHYG